MFGRADLSERMDAELDNDIVNATSVPMWAAAAELEDLFTPFGKITLQQNHDHVFVSYIYIYSTIEKLGIYIYIEIQLAKIYIG